MLDAIASTRIGEDVDEGACLRAAVRSVDPHEKVDSLQYGFLPNYTQNF